MNSLKLNERKIAQFYATHPEKEKNVFLGNKTQSIRASKLFKASYLKNVSLVRLPAEREIAKSSSQ